MKEEKKLLESIDFGNEAGDDIRPSDLAEYFVEQSLAQEFTDHRYPLLVATGKKGVGKSALIQWASYKLPRIPKKMLVVSCRGSDLSRVKLGITSKLTTPNEHIQDWMARICTIINRELAKTLNLALADDKITLIEAAEVEGYKQRNLVRSLLQRFKGLIPNLNAEPQAISSEVEILKRARPCPVWLLIDDLDATFQNTSAECMELSTFFSACRYLARDLEDVTIRATMRTDVWPVIRRYDEALDKMEQYIRPLTWAEDDYRKLLARRIRYELKRLGIRYRTPPKHVHSLDRDYNLIKMTFVEKVPWGSEGRVVPIHKVIHTLSYARPRWAIQLCKLCKKDAVKHHDEKIGKNNIDNVWGAYGRKRIADIVAEHKHQCPEIEELVNSFRGAQRVVSRDELLKWITNRVTNHLTPTIEGKRVKSNVEIAHFLYRVGFLQARSQESDAAYEHYNFDDMPDFLTSRTNNDFGVLWEIHPSYRQALDIVKLNRSQRLQKGLIRERVRE